MRAEADAMLERVAAAGKNVEAMWQGSWREQLLGERESDDAISSGRVAQMAATVSSIHDVQYHSACFMRVITDARLTGAVAQLIGDNVQLHHTKYHVKPPAFGAPFPMHQDYPYFPHESHTMLAAAIHIDAADVENGCLCVVPGSNQLGPLRHQTDGHHFLPLGEWPLERAIPCEADEGDVLMLNYLTVHGSYVNRSSRAPLAVGADALAARSPDRERTSLARARHDAARRQPARADRVGLKFERGVPYRIRTGVAALAGGFSVRRERQPVISWRWIAPTPSLTRSLTTAPIIGIAVARRRIASIGPLRHGSNPSLARSCSIG
jgi:phytanoyl-CoA hydroxylase